MFADFEQKFIETSGARINVLKGGSGFPVLLLHGYPQTHVMWHKIAPLLAQEFTVIATDMRGYGDSAKPKGNEDHSNYSKRTMARDQVEVMSQLGYEEFYLVGHNRGARVSYRLTLDYPQKVKKLAVMDIIPTYRMYANTDKDFATFYYHWFFLIQPSPLPETLIGSNPEFFLRNCLERWSQDFSAFTPEALAEYIRCFSAPETIHSTCEDYRASATIDLIDDEFDMTEKIHCPLLVLWGSNGLIERKYDVLSTWWSRGSNIRGKSIECGHFLPEEAPEDTYAALREFLLT
jgi:haloacetate dehalogenase